MPKKGFTLIELVVTVAVLATVTSIAIPSFMNHIRRQEAKRVVHTMKTILVNARVVALTQRQRIVVCFTNDGLICNKAADRLIMSFYDLNANGAREVDEAVLDMATLRLDRGSLRFRFGLGRHYVRFTPDTGMSRGYLGSLTYCSTSGDMTQARSVVVSQQGRVRESFDFDGDGIHDKNSSGEHVSCT